MHFKAKSSKKARRVSKVEYRMEKWSRGRRWVHLVRTTTGNRRTACQSRKLRCFTDSYL
jgi:endonuclease III